MSGSVLKYKLLAPFDLRLDSCTMLVRKMFRSLDICSQSHRYIELSWQIARDALDDLCGGRIAGLVQTAAMA
jgi:hypothetical protein